tara:strand:- start:452 stop:685 length:234 start_codon:yes stop_codon:yes gene_type:complete
MFLEKELHINFYLPVELVDLIADYHDYTKYCMPEHKELYTHVVIDIIEIKKIFCHDDNLSPSIIYQCWGKGWPEEWN